MRVRQRKFSYSKFTSDFWAQFVDLFLKKINLKRLWFSETESKYANIKIYMLFSAPVLLSGTLQ